MSTVPLRIGMRVFDMVHQRIGAIAAIRQDQCLVVVTSREAGLWVFCDCLVPASVENMGSIRRANDGLRRAMEPEIGR